MIRQIFVGRCEQPFEFPVAVNAADIFRGTTPRTVQNIKPKLFSSATAATFQRQKMLPTVTEIVFVRGPLFVSTTRKEISHRHCDGISAFDFGRQPISVFVWVFRDTEVAGIRHKVPAVIIPPTESCLDNAVQGFHRNRAGHRNPTPYGRIFDLEQFHLKFVGVHEFPAVVV